MANILVVDDLSTNRDVLVTLLSYHGHHVIEAADGSEGLAALHAEDLDLVITDVLMPVMDGFEFVRRLRLDPIVSGIPVVFHTAHYGEHEARALARAGGVSEVLTKPAGSSRVMTAVARALSGASNARTPDNTRPLALDFDSNHLRLLTDTLSETTRDLGRVTLRSRELTNMALAFAAERDPERRLQRVCASACDTFEATYVALGIIDRDDRTVRLTVSHGAAPPQWITPDHALVGMFETVVAERRTVRGETPRAFLMVPLASSDHVYGWMCLVRNEGPTFADDDERALTAIAGQIGSAYELEYERLARAQMETTLSHHRNLTERGLLALQQDLDALRGADERMRCVLAAAGVGIWDMDYATLSLRWSDVLEAQYGLVPGSFRSGFDALIERVHPDDRQSVIETFAGAATSGGEFTLQHRTLRRDGTERWLRGAGRVFLDAEGQPVRGVGVSLDVTDRRAVESVSPQAQKMDTAGRRLAGGVAHDFNNLLTVMLGHCEILLKDLDPEDVRREDVNEIRKAGVSAAMMTRQLLAFSRKQVIEPTLLDLNVVLTDLRGMLGGLLGKNVTVVLSLGLDAASVLADRGQMEQIIINLAVNARDAMPHGGTLTIETASLDVDTVCDTTGFSMMPGLTPGPYVVLSVSDTGTGMTHAVRARVFEPFFTTKESGKGTGIGLAIVHDIVTRSGGRVGIRSDVGRGTSFQVYLPRVDPGGVRVAPGPPADAGREGTGTPEAAGRTNE